MLDNPQCPALPWMVPWVFRKSYQSHISERTMEVERTIEEEVERTYNRRVQWKWNVRTIEGCNGSGTYNRRVQWKWNVQ